MVWKMKNAAVSTGSNRTAKAVLTSLRSKLAD